MKSLLAFCLVLNIAVVAQANVSLNSMCYMLDKGGRSSIQGDHASELFEIASVSKVVTSFWALRELGPQFRFATRIYLTSVARDIFDVHIQGSRDPFWGRQLTHFLFSELNKRGVRQIRRLTFDENLEFRWLVLTDNVEPVNPSSQEIADSIARHIRALASEYPRTRQEAAVAGLTLPKSLALNAQSVEFLSKDDFRPASDSTSFILKSAPLFRYLKEMNIVSNNHVADRLFDILGGVARFRGFLQSVLGMSERDVDFINGSGNSVIGGNGIKQYNKATCEAIVRIQYQMQAELQSHHSMSLKDVMAVSGSDGGTLSPRFDSIPNSLVAKTGTVDPAVTLAGVLSTQQGDVYFGIFMDTTSPSDWNNARDQVRSRVMGLIQKHGGRKSFAYTPKAFLPFDAASTLTSTDTLNTALP